MTEKKTSANTNGNEFACNYNRLSNVLMSKPKIFVKEGCPWCIDALSYFKSKSIDLEIIEVRNDPERMKELLEISGQSKTPTFRMAILLWPILISKSLKTPWHRILMKVKS